MVNALGTLFLSVLGLSSSFSHSQDSSSVMSFELTLEIEVTSKSITSDYLGNAYTIDANEIAKYSAAGILISSFSDKNAGTITSVDASNPLRVQVFYQDFGQIIYLDDVLSVIGSKIIGKARYFMLPSQLPPGFHPIKKYTLRHFMNNRCL